MIHTPYYFDLPTKLAHRIEEINQQWFDAISEAYRILYKDRHPVTFELLDYE